MSATPTADVAPVRVTDKAERLALRAAGHDLTRSGYHQIAGCSACAVESSPSSAGGAVEAAGWSGAWQGAVPATIAVDRLVPDPENPRRDLGDLTELAASIAAIGVLQPVTVVPLPGAENEGRYRIVVGHRRVVAAALAGEAAVPALIRANLADFGVVAALVENLLRAGLSPLEEASGYKTLRDAGLSQAQIADRVGVNQGTVSKRLSLLRLPPEALAMVESGRLPVAEAVEAAKLPPAALATAVADLQAGVSPSGALARAAREHEALLRRDGVIADHLKRGYAILDPITDWPSREERPLIAEPDGSRWGQAPQWVGYGGPVAVGVTPSQHEGEPCAGVVVATSGATTYVCTDPQRHGLPSRADAADAVVEASRARQAELAAAQAEQARLRAERRALLGAVAVTTRERAMSDYVALALLESALTDIAEAGDDQLFPSSGVWAEANLAAGLELLEAGDGLPAAIEARGALRVCFAALLADLDDRVAQLPLPVLEAHVALLGDLGGHDLTPEELALLADRRPPARPSPWEAGALAWYDPAGDEGRWVYDEGELEALGTEDGSRLVFPDPGDLAMTLADDVDPVAALAATFGDVEEVS